MAQSLMDYVFRRLALDYMSFEERSMLGIYSAEERQRHLETGSYEPMVEETGSAEELITHEVPVLEAAPAEAPAPAPAAAVSEAHTSAELLEKITGTAVDSPLCFTCGTKMRRSGSCYICEGCGSTSGCS